MLARRILEVALAKSILEWSFQAPAHDSFTRLTLSQAVRIASTIPDEKLREETLSTISVMMRRTAKLLMEDLLTLADDLPEPAKKQLYRILTCRKEQLIPEEVNMIKEFIRSKEAEISIYTGTKQNTS